MIWRPPAPSVAIAPAQAAAMIDAEDLVLRLIVPPEFDTGPTFAGRVRGALGDALYDQRADELRSGARRRGLWGMPPAFDVFFADPPIFPPRQGPLAAAPARPYVLFTECRRPEVTVTLRVFGLARVWFPMLRSALELAITSRGLSVIPLARSKARFTDYKISHDHPERPTDLANNTDARLVALSPWHLDRKGRIALDTAMLGGSVISRVSGVLAWCGCWLDASTHGTADELRGLRASDATLGYRKDLRHSTRQDRILEQDGMEGALTLHNIGGSLRNLIPLISLTGIGSGTTTGFGRVAIFPEHATLSTRTY
jgi:hypothetical protein